MTNLKYVWFIVHSLPYVFACLFVFVFNLLIQCLTNDFQVVYKTRDRQINFRCKTLFQINYVLKYHPEYCKMFNQIDEQINNNFGNL